MGDESISGNSVVGLSVTLAGVEVVFLDAGGTLWQVEPPAEDIYTRALARAGIRQEPAAVRDALERVDGEMKGKYPEDPSAEPEFWDTYNAAVAACLGYPFNAHLSDAINTAFRTGFRRVVFPDVPPALDRLVSRGVRLGVISNAGHDLPRRVEEVSLRRYFESLTYSGAAGAEKPDRRIFEVALETMNVDADRAVHIGDSYEQDVLGAASAGIRAIWLDRASRGGHAGPRATTLLEAELLVHR